jgi:multicomponent Na+:H+ antiporter subunit G
VIEFKDILAISLISAGAFFMLVGSVGIVRLPDFFSRTHAIGKSDTLGIMLVLGGLALYLGVNVNSAKLLIAIAFVAVANSTGSHALARAALLSGLKPWFSRENRGKGRIG